MRPSRLTLLALGFTVLTTALLSRPLHADDASVAPPEGLSLKAHGSEVSSIEISSNARWLYTTAVTPDCAVRVFDTATWKVKRELKGWPVQFSPDGTLLAICEEGTQSISIFDLESGAKIHECGRCNMGPLCISPDNKLVATGYNLAGTSKSDHGWRAGVWELASGKEVQTVQFNDGPAGAVGFSADSRDAVLWQWRPRLDPDPESTSGEWTPGSVGFADQKAHATFESVCFALDVATGGIRPLASPTGPREVRDRVRLTPDGQRVLWSTGAKEAGAGVLTLTDLQTGATYWTAPAGRGGICFAAGGRSFLHWRAHDPNPSSVRDTETGAVLATCRLPATVSCATLVGEHVACGLEDGTVSFVPLVRDPSAR